MGLETPQEAVRRLADSMKAVTDTLKRTAAQQRGEALPKQGYSQQPSAQQHQSHIGAGKLLLSAPAQPPHTMLHKEQERRFQLQQLQQRAGGAPQLRASQPMMSTHPQPSTSKQAPPAYQRTSNTARSVALERMPGPKGIPHNTTDAARHRHQAHSDIMPSTSRRAQEPRPAQQQQQQPRQSPGPQDLRSSLQRPLPASTQQRSQQQPVYPYQPSPGALPQQQQRPGAAGAVPGRAPGVPPPAPMMGGGVLLTEAALKQLPLGDRPSGYKHQPSDLGTHAAWWKAPPPASAMSYPRTAVTERGSATPSEYAAWESKMNDLEKTLKDERLRRQKFEEQLKALQDVAVSRGGLTTGAATAGVSKPSAGHQQMDAARQAIAARRY